MNLVEVMEMFPTQQDCIAYLERLRWQGSPECPHCESTHVRPCKFHKFVKPARSIILPMV